MGREIERKFLLQNDSWRELAKGTLYRQGYLNSEKGCTVRVRIMGSRAVITIKGPPVRGVRAEYEYEIPLTDAEEMLDTLCHQPLISKYRHKIPFAGFIWEVDEFLAENSGLIMAEIELQNFDQPFSKPDWIGREVTGNPNYNNGSLVHYPFARWSDADRNA
jgi:adenylate cyclase